MKYDFDKKVERNSEIYWLKDMLTQEHIKEQGMLSYSGAEFEFPTCPAFTQGVIEFAQKGLFGFSLPKGRYTEQCCWWMKEVRETKVAPDWLVTTHGTIFSLATVIRMYTEPGENIMVFTPGYHRYEQAAARLGRGTVKIPLLEEKGQFSMNWARLEEQMTRQENKILVLCNPNNPTGNRYTKEELVKIVAMARKNQVLVFCDEIFADIVFDTSSIPVYAQVAAEDDLAISCTSMGKTFSLTGVNHANVWIKNPILRERFVKQRDADHYGSLDPMVCAGLISAYTEEGKAWIQEMKQYMWQNYVLVDSFMKMYIPQAIVTKPQGTFVAWIDYSRLGLSKKELYQILVQDGCFAGDEGEEYYGKDTCFRYSLAVPRQELEKSLQKLKECIEVRDIRINTKCSRREIL